jgi:hypothetical protein
MSRMKTLMLATLLAASATLTTEVQAAFIHNGLDANGIRMNGLDANGIRMNGLDANGIRMNGLDANGIRMNGTTMSSIRPSDAINPNRLHLRAVRLPGE